MTRETSKRDGVNPGPSPHHYPPSKAVTFQDTPSRAAEVASSPCSTASPHTHTRSCNDRGGGSDASGPSNTSLPSMLLIRHRRGYSTVHLSPHQKATFDQDALEAFVLYKEQKYNAVNTLDRFCLFLILFQIITISCYALSLSSTQWTVVKRQQLYTSYGLFVSCLYGPTNHCYRRFGTHDLNIPEDPVGSLVCPFSRSFVVRYVGALWSLAILLLICLLVSLILSCAITFRPTRSGLSLIVSATQCAAVVLGIIISVVYAFFIRCTYQKCTSGGNQLGSCSGFYSWAYDLFIGGVASNAFTAVIALGFQTFVQLTWRRARGAVRRERLRSTRDRVVVQPLSSKGTRGPPPRLGLEDTARSAEASRAYGAAGRSATRGSGHVPTNTEEEPGGGRDSPTASRHTGGTYGSRLSAAPDNGSYGRPGSLVQFDDDYLTAHELGVEIDGADDWLYDDRSDMYYSFQRHMFWDPLSKEYFNCQLKTWQVQPDTIVEVRDVRRYELRRDTAGDTP